MKFILAATWLLLMGLAIYPATYKGKNVDGKRYRAVVEHSDGGSISADVRFDGRFAYLYFETWTHKVALSKEEIDDPRSIKAYDGIHEWTIELFDKLD